MKLLALYGRSSVAAPSREEHYALQEGRPRRTARTGSLAESLLQATRNQKPETPRRLKQ